VIWDLYEIGGPAWFYVGQAKRLKDGGWERRVAAHRDWRGRSPRASQLLATGAHSRCVGSVLAHRPYVNFLEAHLWDARVARGWVPAHPRPREDANWASSWTGCKHSPEARAKLSAKSRGRRASLETRAKIGASSKGRRHSAESRAKVSAALRGKPKADYTRVRMSEAQRRRPAELRAQAAAKLLGRSNGPFSVEGRARMSAAHLGKRHTPETLAKMSEAQRLRRSTEAAKRDPDGRWSRHAP
jgi:hypothetical protein